MLTTNNYVKALDVAFYGQRLYVVGPKAKDFLGEKILHILCNRSMTPRFLQHSISVTNVRIALLSHGFSDWRFEQQIRDSIQLEGRLVEIRPDGLVEGKEGPVFIEVDLGNVSLPSFSRKVLAFEQYLRSGRLGQNVKVLIVTTGKLRKRHLETCVTRKSARAFVIETFDAIGCESPGGWS